MRTSTIRKKHGCALDILLYVYTFFFTYSFYLMKKKFQGTFLYY